MNDTRHQCRWCTELVVGDASYCCLKKKVMSEASTKRVNKCKWWDFNEIDAYDLGHIYMERVRHEKQVKGQISLWGG